MAETGQEYSSYNSSTPAREIAYEESFEAVEAHSGPLPSPHILKGYADLIENGPERIMRMAEKQLDHNMMMESKGLKAGVRSGILGQILGFAIGLILIASGVWLTYLGHDTVGGIIFGSCLVAVIGVFLKNIFFKKGK